jgi:hypothetical protein
MTTTLSEYDEKDEEETINKTFAGKYDICNNTSDEDLLDEGLDETHTKTWLTSGESLPF